MLGHADPTMVATIVREVEAQFANGLASPATPVEQPGTQLLEQRTGARLERIRSAVALVDVAAEHGAALSNRPAPRLLLVLSS